MIGATGGIGMVVIQLAAAAGAHIIATAGPQDAEYIKGLGAQETVDYTTGDTIEQVKQLHPEGVDVVIDVINIGDAIKHVTEAIRPGGKFVSSLQGPDAKTCGREDLTAAYIRLSAEPGDLENLASQVASGKIKVEISRTYPLEKAAQALMDLEQKHTRGKTVISIK